MRRRAAAALAALQGAVKRAGAGLLSARDEAALLTERAIPFHSGTLRRAGEARARAG